MKRYNDLSEMDAEDIYVQLEQEYIDCIDEYSAEQQDAPTRPEVIQRVLQDWFVRNGYLKS